MTILKDDALEFAREHITKYYDTDFFPKPFEFEALWHCWDDVKRDLTSRNIRGRHVCTPRIMAALKPNNGYRVVHQTEPLESLIYTALAYEVAEAVEAARLPANQCIACSYRLSLSDGSFFSGGSGYSDFVEKTEELSISHEFVLLTDITDFYNQIYLHRLSNAIESSSSSLKSIGDDIEWFITALNNRPSQGIPVGPAASVVMSEAIMIDIDEFIRNKGFSHTRYVDDFRIFGNSEQELSRIERELTIYLYENHRLTLSGQKTFIVNASNYVESELHNEFALERQKIFESFEMFNPYTEEAVEVDFEVTDKKELLIKRASATIDTVLAFKTLDLGLARSAIRNAKRHKEDVLVDKLIANYSFFSPVVNDVVLYFDALTDSEFVKEIQPKLPLLLNEKAIESELVRFWTEWYLSGHSEFLKNSEIRQFIYDSPFIENRARAAISERNISWVREMKGRMSSLGNWERRAVLNATKILSKDEREHWLKPMINSAPIQLDRWIAKWVYDTSKSC